jgi:hypothetical protein
MSMRTGQPGLIVVAATVVVAVVVVAAVLRLVVNLVVNRVVVRVVNRVVGCAIERIVFSVATGVAHRRPHELRGGSSAAEASLRRRNSGMVRCGHDRTGSSSSSTSLLMTGIMPITSSRPVVSELPHAASACRHRISPSRRP